MAYTDIIRVRKGKEYRLSLSEEQRAVLPEHSAGLIELEDVELEDVQGAGSPRLGMGRDLFKIIMNVYEVYEPANPQ